MGQPQHYNSQAAWLLALIVDSADAERDELFFSNPVIIGRAENCDIVIQNGLVSREHLEFYQTSRGWGLRDLDSTNGSFVDGERIEEISLNSSGSVALGHLGPRIKWRLQALGKPGSIQNDDSNSPADSEETWLEEPD